MKIGITKRIEPIELGQLNYEKIKQFFTNRRNLHGDSIPEFACYIEKKAWDAFIAHADNKYHKEKHEATGVIIGSFVKDEFGQFVIGTHFEMGTGSTTGVWCEISTEDNARINSVCEKKGLNQIIWIHSHPKLGVFYSGTDNNTLKTMYYDRHHVGIVVDNIQNDSLAFKVVNSDVKPFHEYYLFNEFDDKKISKPFQSSNSSKQIPASNNEENIYSQKIFKALTNIDKKIDSISDNTHKARKEFTEVHDIFKNLGTEINEKLSNSTNSINEVSESGKNEIAQILLKLSNKLEGLKFTSELESIKNDIYSIKDDFIKIVDDVLKKNSKEYQYIEESKKNQELISEKIDKLSKDLFKIRKSNIRWFSFMLFFASTLLLAISILLIKA